MLVVKNVCIIYFLTQQIIKIKDFSCFFIYYFV